VFMWGSGLLCGSRVRVFGSFGSCGGSGLQVFGQVSICEWRVRTDAPLAPSF